MRIPTPRGYQRTASCSRKLGNNYEHSPVHHLSPFLCSPPPWSPLPRSHYPLRRSLIPRSTHQLFPSFPPPGSLFLYFFHCPFPLFPPFLQPSLIPVLAPSTQPTTHFFDVTFGGSLASKGSYINDGTVSMKEKGKEEKLTNWKVGATTFQFFSCSSSPCTF